MKVIYDEYGFVLQAFSMESEIIIPTGYYEVLKHGIIFPEGIFDEMYYLPRYRYNTTTSEIYLITDPSEYQVHSTYWANYLNKLGIEVRHLLETKTKEEMKALYDSSPPYKQEVIYDQIELRYADRVDQYRINLTTETIIRILLEMLHIRDVEQRAFTQDEIDTYTGMLIRFHQHGYIPMQFPMSPTAWYNLYQEHTLNILDNIRAQCVPERIYITGR